MAVPQPRQVDSPGLNARLAAELRPQFASPVILVDPSDPVMGGPSCAVPVCERVAVLTGMCVRIISSGTRPVAPTPRRGRRRRRRSGGGWPNRSSVRSARAVARSASSGCAIPMPSAGRAMDDRIARGGWPMAVAARRCRTRPPAGSRSAVWTPRARPGCVRSTAAGGPATAAHRSRRGSPTARCSAQTGSTFAHCRYRCDWKSPTRSNVALTHGAPRPARTSCGGGCANCRPVERTRCWSGPRPSGTPIWGSPWVRDERIRQAAGLAAPDAPDTCSTGAYVLALTAD